jgi:class 3 adenylate cyclase
MRQLTFLSRSADIIRKYEGQIVKTVGDEVLATFKYDYQPKQIIYCCSEVYNSIKKLKGPEFHLQMQRE